MAFPSISNGEIVLFQDDFVGAALAGEVAGQVENSGTAAIVVAQRGGAVGLVTGASDTNRVQITTGLNHLVSDGSIRVQWRVKNVTAILTRALFIGLTDTVSLENPIQLSGTTFTSNATDAVGFVFDTAATTDVWYTAGVNADTDKGGTAVSIDGSQVAPTINVYENFAIEVTPQGDAILSYGKDNADGHSTGMREVARITAAVATTALLTPIALLETRSAAAKTAYVDSLIIMSGRQMS
jgi:hypothetical protein